MVDIKTGADETLKSQANPAQATPAAKHNRKKSAGEVAFDRIVYTGIGFGVNEVSSLWITDQFLYGRNFLAGSPGLKKMGAWFSQEGFNRASEFIAKIFKLTETIAKDGSKILPKEKGGNALLMVLLLSGGTLLLLPMKWLENHKIGLVRKANHFIDWIRGNTLAAESVAARDGEVEQHIACSPRQSWLSMLAGRVVALAASVGTGTFLVGPENNHKLMNWSEKLLTGSLQPSGQKNTAHRWARLVSVESYSCAIASIVLEITSKLFARHTSAPHDPELCHAVTALPVSNGNGQPASDSECTGKYSKIIQSQKAQVSQARAQI